MSWRKWFPEHDIPREVERLVKSGVLKDKTKGHDVVPHFEGILGDGSELVFWVDHPESSRRHDPWAPRYGIELYGRKSAPIDIIETEALSDALQALKNTILARGGLRRLP